MGPHSKTCHPALAEVTFPPLPQPTLVHKVTTAFRKQLEANAVHIL